MNEGQQKALELMLTGQNICLTGSAGVGKSYTISEFLSRSNKTVAVTSTTGVSAILINGMTLHSWAGIGLGDGTAKELLSLVKSKPKHKKRIKETDVLIIDEISMLDAELLDKIEFIVRSLRYNGLPFGDIQVIFSGDFAQIPPVKAKGFAFMAECWPRLFPPEHIVHLTQVMRQTDQEFIAALNKIRFSSACLEDPNDPSRLLLDSRVIEPDKPVEIEVDGCKMEPTLLYSHKADVDYLNKQRLKELLSTQENHIFDMTVKVSKKEHQVYIEGVLKHLQCSAKLHLAVGAQVMLLVNQDFDAQLVNGSRGVVKSFMHAPDGKAVGIEVAFRNGRTEIISPHLWEVKVRDDVKIKIIQYPLTLAYALTIHKSQGSTLDFVTVDLGSCFAPGQVYVALSRARCLDGLYILDIDYTKIRTHPAVKAFYAIK